MMGLQHHPSHWLSQPGASRRAACWRAGGEIDGRLV